MVFDKARRYVVTIRHIKRGNCSGVVSQEGGERIYGVGMKLSGRFDKRGGRIGGGEGVDGEGSRFRLRRRREYIR